VNAGDAEAAVLALLSERQSGATICPSEAARRIATDNKSDWREAMPVVHTAVDHLLDQKAITLSWKGKALPARSGPYRIGRTTD
tara:strand:+ start:1194 stop:1445 length:252 start_codon:yes stop_codon:yes gene_type:complete